jgi:hypothetical protein
MALDIYKKSSYYLGMIKCPSCNAILYSRTSGACSECHAPLPKEMQPTEEEKKLRDAEYKMMKIWVEQAKEKASKNPIKKMLG